MTSHEISPLRYPGGKGSLAPFLGRLIHDQVPRCEVYVEPFAGGAGAALRLLYDEFVDQIVLNDLNAGLAAFWRAVFHRTEDLAHLIETAPINIDSWHEHRAIYTGDRSIADDLELAFATFFLNRTNRSGILDARPIGGLQQTGTWKIDARFNRTALAWRVRELGHYRHRVIVSENDGVEVASRYVDRRHFVYADPPYLQRSADLYLNTLTWSDHARLASVLGRSSARWMVTYDNDPRVKKLYPTQRRVAFALAHTAARPHVGEELAVFANTIDIDTLLGLGKGARFVA